MVTTDVTGDVIGFWRMNEFEAHADQNSQFHWPPLWGSAEPWAWSNRKRTASVRPAL